MAGFELTTRLVALGLLLTSFSTLAATEQPPLTEAATLLGTAVKGTNYTIETPVASDGMLYAFTLETPFGRHTVFGEQLLKLRLHELAVLEKLEALSTSEEFSRGLATGLGKPIDAVADAMTNPLALASGAVSGFGEAFGKVGAGLTDPYPKPANATEALISASAARRQIAYDYDVDPYTSFPPLAARLNQLAEASALGGIAVKGAVKAPAGLAAAGPKSSGKTGELIRTKTVPELEALNREALHSLGIDERAAQAFLANGNYTPTDKTMIVAALSTMRQAEGLSLYLSLIAKAQRPDLAFFHRLQTQWIAAYHARVAPLEAFVSMVGMPFMRRADGKLVGFFPVDMIAWTDAVEKAALAMNERILKERANGLELRITGTVTEDAQQGFKKLGWRVFPKDTGLIDGSRVGLRTQSVGPAN
ncbi:hypothetical protein [Rhodoligotrophos ferricapiens]|uniref:hypothetical protein n=1 Tax=Rhodoligotrophos ferricapiens TaxID=3069264 RepID=UPI00315CAA12